MIAKLLAVAFALEWNPTYRTDVPYEVEVSPAKLGANAFKVFADGKELKTTKLEGVMPGTVDLRFRVPAGTKGLTCEGSKGEGALATNAGKVDNVFLGALDAGSAAKWKYSSSLTMTPCANGFVFATDGKKGGEATYEVEIPETMAGMPVMQEIEVKNLTPLVWGGDICVIQLDANGRKLPETVADIRWTTHLRPCNKQLVYRNEGHIHLKARKLRFVATIRNVNADYDNYGYRIEDPEMKRGKLEVTRISVRAAERLPFPKWNDDFFGEGVSGEAGDRSFRLGGKARRSMFFQGTSRASWSQAYEFDDDAERALPAEGEGTVEAWFRPDWKNCKAKKVTLFDAYHGYSAATHEKPKKSMLRLDYLVKDKTFIITLQDYLRHGFTGEAKGVEFEDGKWTHVALQWKPGGVAELYVDGKKRASVAIGEFEGVPFKDRALLKKLRSLSDAWAYEFFFGADCDTARLSDTGNGAYFEGEGDALRISHTLRYHGDFTPVKRPEVDGETGVYFSFDRVFDGVMGSGFGFVPASVRADEDRVEHRLGNVQYYPKEILPENDPAKVLDKYNYKQMPTDADCRMARVLKTKRVTAKPGDRISIGAAEKAYPAYIEFRNLSKTEPLMYPIAVADGRLDPRSFGDMQDSLAGGKGLRTLSDRERVNRVFQYMLSASDYFANHQLYFEPGTDRSDSVCYEAMVVLNGYCGFECGPLNNMTANMMATVAGCPAGVTGGYGHEFEQVFYDGKNHIYDLSAQKFFPAFDNESAAYLKEMGDQPGLKQRGFGSPDHFIRKGRRGCWVNAPSYQEKCAMTVNPGEVLRISYANFGTANNLMSRRRSGLYGGGLSPWEHDYGKAAGVEDKDKWIYRKDRIFTHRAGAAISFDGVPKKENPAFGDFAANSFTYRVKSCYPICWGEYSAKLRKGGFAALELSTDGGKTYRPLPDEAGIARSEYLVKGRHEYLVRVKAPIESVVRFVSHTEGEVNPRTYPGWIMKGGRTDFTFKAEPGGKAEVTFAWKEDAKEITVEGEVASGTIPGCERSLVLVDAEKPSVAFKVSGIGAKATAKAYGKLDAAIKDCVLKLRYQPKKAAVIRRGADDPEKKAEFPQFAAVDIIDGEAVKTITVVIAKGARLAIAEDPVMPENGAKKTLKFEPLPAGRYAIFALGRFNAQADGVTRIDFDGPGPDGKDISFKEKQKNMRAYSACRYRNDYEDYLKAEFGQKGQRCRWKWDMANDEGARRATCNSGCAPRITELPETDHLDFRLPWANKGGEVVELKAVMILPEPNMDFFLDARKILFGYNTDPFHM